MQSLILLAVLSSNETLAGGLGVVGTGGLHDAKAYYYNTSGQQGIDSQSRPNYGGGLEVLLGDRDDRVLGLSRFYLNYDLPVTEPDTQGVTDAIYPLAHEESARRDALVMMGVQWGLWGDPNAFQVIVNTLGGSAVATPDNLEYLQLEVGAGVTYMLSEALQVTGSVSFDARYRKDIFFSENAWVGVRYLFD